MLFCCGDQLNVASPSALTPQREAPAASAAPPARQRGRAPAVRGASQSRKCGLLLAVSLRDKWLQRAYHSRLILTKVETLTISTGNKGDAEKTLGGPFKWLKQEEN
ncbi:hypothetical protein FQA47_023952 [Oryzias melastigma]|uniref:Uncharacterized protein n=1 Tax=Oryzias melastigma TaxID=30732 RepID=A0A834L3C3_ORYME|nr:hypothetical protein FQA47_023952 [Oryzias melastigma]